jgi:hypothetical protein
MPDLERRACAAAVTAALGLLSIVSPALADGPVVDASVSTHQASASSAITSGAVTTSASNDLLVAFLASDGPGKAGGESFASVSGGGLAWKLRQRVNSQPGTTEIWTAVAPAPLTSVSVTARRAAGAYAGSATLVAFSGARTDDAAVAGAGAASGAPSVTVTPLRAGSWVWGVGNDYDRAAARTVGAGQSLVDQYLASVGDTYWVQRQSAAGATAGTGVTLNDTAPAADEYEFAGIEIAPAAMAPPDTTPPTAPAGLTATANGASEIDLAWGAASDDVGVTGYRVLRDGTVVGTPSGTSYRDTGLAASSTHRYTVEAVDAAGNVGPDSNPAATTTAAAADATPPTVTVTQPAAGATVSGTAQLAATASDDVGVAGVRFLVDGAAVGGEDASAPYTAAWDSTAVADGPHAITAVARDAAGNTRTSAPVSVTVANGSADAPKPIALDASVTVHQGTAASSIAAPGITTSGANELLLAFVASDGPPAPKTQSFSSVSGGGLTWRLRERTDTQSGTAEIWQAVAPSPVSKLVVTAARAGGAYTGAMTVAAFANASTTVDGAVAGANGGAGAPSVSLTTTRPGSWVWGVGEDYDRAVARTVGAGQTKVDEYLSPSQDTYWVQRRDALSPAAGTAVSIDDPAPAGDRWNLSAIEVVAATGPGDATPPTVAVSAPSDGATVSGAVKVTADASDAGGVAAVQPLLDGQPLGGRLTSPPYSVDWSTVGAANGDHVLTATAWDEYGNSATSAPVHVTVANVAGAAPSLDPATPGPGPVLNNVTTTTSPSFSPPAGTVVYAVFSMDSPAPTAVTTVTSVTNSGAPLTWHLLGRENHSNGSTVGGFVEVWWADNPTAQPGIAATATFSQPTKNVPAPVGDFQILVMDGAAGDQSAAAWGSAYTYNLSSTPAATVTTTAANSRVFGVFDDWDNSNTPQPGADQSIISIVLNSTDRDGYWMQAKGTPAATPGAVTMNATVVGNQNAWKALAWEVRAAGA